MKTAFTRKTLSTLLLIFSFAHLCSGQENYAFWVQFTNKKNTPYSVQSPSAYLSQRAIQRRIKQNISIDSTDIPVNQTYVNSLIKLGAKIHSRSKWLNGVTITLNDSAIISSIRTLAFVKRIELTYITSATKKSSKISKIKQERNELNESTYGTAYRQIDMLNGQLLHKDGFKGRGMQIAILDVGFENVNTMTVFDSLRNNHRLLGTKDFVDPTADIYKQNGHGSVVLSVIAGNQPNRFIGTAPEASYWLIRTEDANSELPIEVDNMVAGMEFADSVGVDIINASLGYFQFDNLTMNYNPADFDGKTIRGSIGAEMASKKGILVVCSAGNEGEKAWQKITAPADAEDILSVGAVNWEKIKAPFSSTGPTADGRIKPTVCALGSGTELIKSDDTPGTASGTSLSAPIIAGLSACLWQAFPSYTNRQIMDLIIRHSDNYSNPDNYIGYGIPDFYASYLDADNNTKIPKEPSTHAWVKIYPNHGTTELRVTLPEMPNDSCPLVIYNKKGIEIYRQDLTEAYTVITSILLKRGRYTVAIGEGNKLYRQTLVKR